MAARIPDGTRWHVVYTKPPSKRKLDGILTLRYMHGGVIPRVSLSAADGSTALAARIVPKGDEVQVSQAFKVESYAVEVGELVEDGLRCSSTIDPLPPRSSIPARTSSALAQPSPTDRASIASVGTEWIVTYSSNSIKKVKKILDGIVRLVQKNGREQKVVLFDNEGKEIDELFLGGSKDITCGMTLTFGNFVVDVNGIKGSFSSVPEVVVIDDSPTNQMKLPRQHLKSSFQGKSTNRVSPQDHAQREIKEIIEDSGTRGIRAPSKAFGKQEIQPKRRDIVQVINSCKRPVNSSRESSSTANSCTREQAEREGTSTLSSTSGRQYEEESSATLDCVDRIQKLNVGRTCPESYDDDCFYIEHDLIQQESRLGNNRTRSVINLDDEFDVVVEQHEMLAEKVEGEASPRTRRVFTKCSEGVKNILDDENFRVQDFWEGYKLYCFGHYSHCSRSKGQFLASKMGRVVCLLHTEKDVRWGSKFDETVRQVWAMMEEYAKVRHGKDCTNLRVLMEEFEDVKKLSSSENGCLLLQLIEDDEHGTERLYRHSRNFQIQPTNIFDQFRSRLNQVGSNLDNLMKSSGTSSENSAGTLTDLDSRNLGSRNFYEDDSVGNAARFSAGSRNKSEEWCKSALPNFDLGF